jgi:hypothetical protein
MDHTWAIVGVRFVPNVITLTLGLRPKQGLVKLAGEE